MIFTSINTYLEELSSKLVIKEEERNKIHISISTIKARLKNYFRSEISEVIVFGSYTRRTILPRKADDDSDIDIMAVFGYNSSQNIPQTYLNKLKQFAKLNYSRSEVYQDNPTIVLELNHIKFELVPAYVPFSYSNDEYKIPNDWIMNKPNEFNDILTDCNQSNYGMIKPIIRLIKRWNVTNNARNIKSFEIEKAIAENMRFSHYSCSSYTDYLKEAFLRIRNYSNHTEIDAALEQIEQAINDEILGYKILALSKIEEVFKDI